jgi:hypothetical protein
MSRTRESVSIEPTTSSAEAARRGRSRRCRSWGNASRECLRRSARSPSRRALSTSVTPGTPIAVDRRWISSSASSSPSFVATTSLPQRCIPLSSQPGVALDAQGRLQRSLPLVDAGVHDSAVTAGLVQGDPVFLLEDPDPRTPGGAGGATHGRRRGPGSPRPQLPDRLGWSRPKGRTLRGAVAIFNGSVMLSVMTARRVLSTGGAGYVGTLLGLITYARPRERRTWSPLAAVASR